jgi:hypothetical protein
MHYKDKPSFEDLIKNIQQNKYSKFKYPLEYYKRLKEQVEAHETKGRSLQMRRNIIKAQQLANYQNEYDKIRSILEQSITKRERGMSQRTLNYKNKQIFDKLGANQEMFKQRKEHLEKLGARAIDGIN